MRPLNATKDSPTIAISAVPIAKTSGAAPPAACAVNETLRAIAAVDALREIERPMAWIRPSFLATAVMFHLLLEEEVWGHSGSGWALWCEDVSPVAALRATSARGLIAYQKSLCSCGGV